jgi:hypothetical protein
MQLKAGRFEDENEDDDERNIDPVTVMVIVQ